MEPGRIIRNLTPGGGGRMFQGLSVEAEKGSAWKDGLEPRRNFRIRLIDLTKRYIFKE